MTVLVVANGDIPDTDWLIPHLDAAAIVVAADGGARHLRALGRYPDLLIGDFDSLTGEELDTYRRHGVEMIHHPPNKDETDLELALLYVVEQETWREMPVQVFGVLGGRLDQTLANILLLAHPLLLRHQIRLIEPHQQAWLIAGRAEIMGEIGDRISLIPLGGPAVIAATSGLKWPLHDETLYFGPARGVSNVIEALPVRIAVRDGLALCIHTEKGWDR